MIKRDILDLSSFIRIPTYEEIENFKSNLKIGENIFVFSDLTFYKIVSATTLSKEGDYPISNEIKLQKIITIGDSRDLQQKINELRTNINVELNKKENNIEKKSGFNLEKTNEITEDENKLLTSKAGSILKSQIDNVNNRLNSINLTWDRIQNKPIVTNINSNNNENIPTEGSILRYVENKINISEGVINSKIDVINNKITVLENKPFTYDALLNKPIISDSINSNLSNQIASSKAVKDVNDILTDTKNTLNIVNTNLNNLDSDNQDNKNKIINLIEEKKNIKTNIDELEKEKNNHKKEISSLKNDVAGIPWLRESVVDLLNFKTHNNIRFLENTAKFLTDGSSFCINGGSLNDNDIVTEFHFRKGNTINHADIYCGALNAQNKIISQDEIITSGDITAFSDIRLKSNIRKINNALNKVCQLNGYTYDMNNKRSTGVIAQEVEKVLPEVVQDREDGYKTVAYGNMIGLLIEAIKDLKEEIKEIKNGD